MEYHQLLQSIIIIIITTIITLYLLSILVLLGYEVFPQKIQGSVTSAAQFRGYQWIITI